ncbi:DUF1015 domain-containing protein [Rhodothermus profundi]|uniref:Uncharacterized conserved protein, DUF1015 family n=1 Tax=Rhodothermus profundi TaxID=633813 RepID=A0A1M6PU70_9BACT|nr:DUF1015 family protein [Rhodothermus profundi]SHK11478.1 Uncharacterized conserved protein, DUF1015 family [Rhodothermus profundi]
MSLLYPFRALRPIPEKAAEVASPPYDVVSTEEARKLAAGKPWSFLHVIRPEIDLPESTDEHDEAVYAKGAENLRRFRSSSVFVQDAAPALYVYRQQMGAHVQTGVFGCVPVAAYEDGRIVRHEKTRPDKEADRTRHILEQRAHAEPVMLTYPDQEAIDRQIEQITKEKPLYDFVADDAVRHTIWKVDEPNALREAFQAVARVYVADGHHRCAAAARAAAVLRQQEPQHEGLAEYEIFPAVLFPMSQLQILPYHRVIRKLPMSPEAFLQALEARMEVTRNVADPAPPARGTITIYLEGSWHRVVLPPSQRNTVADQLDVARLNEHILEPVLGITDPRTDPNLDFVGGIRGLNALKEMVDRGEVALAIAMYPTSIDELVAVSDAGLLMPPKSTWFEPKLRSGLLIHVFD